MCTEIIYNVRPDRFELAYLFCAQLSWKHDASMNTKTGGNDASSGDDAGLLALSDESWRNLVNFFDLLLQVDRRVNPHLYGMKKT